MTSFSDNFNRANGDVGSPWVVLLGDPQVLSNQFTSPNAEDLAVVDLVDYNHDVTVTVTDLLLSASLYACNTGNAAAHRHGYRFYLYQPDGRAYIDRYENNGSGVNKAMSAPMGTGEPYELRLKVSGHTDSVLVEGFVNGTRVCVFVDSSPVEGSYAGIWSSVGGGGGEDFDDFEAIGTVRPSREPIDDFNRSDGALGIASSGLVWANYRGEFRISTNTAQHTDAPVDYNAAGVDTGFSDGSIEVTVVQAPGAGKGIGLSYRIVDEDNWRFFFVYRNTVDTTWYLYSGKVEAGVGSYDHYLEVVTTNPTGVVLRVDFDGDQITTFYDGIQIEDVFTSSLGQTATIHGIMGEGVPAGSARLDDLYGDFRPPLGGWIMGALPFGAYFLFPGKTISGYWGTDYQEADTNHGPDYSSLSEFSEMFHVSWWSWTAPATGRVRFDTDETRMAEGPQWAGSEFPFDDTVILVFTGSSTSNLSFVAQSGLYDYPNPGDNFNDTTPMGWSSEMVEFDAVAGTTYRIAAAVWYDYNIEFGDLDLEYGLSWGMEQHSPLRVGGTPQQLEDAYINSEHLSPVFLIDDGRPALGYGLFDENRLYASVLNVDGAGDVTQDRVIVGPDAGGGPDGRKYGPALGDNGGYMWAAPVPDRNAMLYMWRQADDDLNQATTSDPGEFVIALVTVSGATLSVRPNKVYLTTENFVYCSIVGLSSTTGMALYGRTISGDQQMWQVGFTIDNDGVYVSGSGGQDTGLSDAGRNSASAGLLKRQGHAQAIFSDQERSHVFELVSGDPVIRDSTPSLDTSSWWFRPHLSYWKTEGGEDFYVCAAMDEGPIWHYTMKTITLSGSGASTQITESRAPVIEDDIRFGFVVGPLDPTRVLVQGQNWGLRVAEIDGDGNLLQLLGGVAGLHEDMDPNSLYHYYYGYPISVIELEDGRNLVAFRDYINDYPYVQVFDLDMSTDG